MRIFPSRILLLLIPLSCTLNRADAKEFTPLFDDQRIIYESEKAQVVYPLSLGPLEKIDGRWTSEREVLVNARVRKRSYEITHPYNLASGWQQVQEHFIQQRAASLVYECLGLECGSSNAWANERFEIKQLYGLDLSQKYQVWQWNEADKVHLAAVYLVQRGNRRIYFQYDHLWPSSNQIDLPPSASVISKDFYRNGLVKVSGLNFDNGNLVADERHIKALAKALNEKPFRLLTVVGYDYFPGSEEDQSQRSLGYANRVSELLSKSGVRSRRIEAVGKGAQEQSSAKENAKVEIHLRSR